MGSAAFLTAEFTAIAYQAIVVAAIVPALLYYFSVYLQVHLRSMKVGLCGVDPKTIPPLRETLRQGGIFAVPLVVLAGALIAGYSPQYVATLATVSVVAVAMLRRSTRLRLRDFYDVLADTTLRVAPAVGACAAAGLVVGGITMTGLAGKFTDLIFLLAGSHTLPSLAIAALILILLGMGMPVPSVYVLGAVLIAPALVKLGLSLMAAHMFIVYFSAVSALTPPVAVAAFAAAPIAQANPLGIGMTAVRFSIVAFLVPFAFAYSGELLLHGAPMAIGLRIAAAVLAVVSLAMALEGFCRRSLRLGLAACAIALFADSWQVQAIAAVFAIRCIVVSARRSGSSTVRADERARS
jgi:TRAP transporter 4TM/12TM fusion protein